MINTQRDDIGIGVCVCVDVDGKWINLNLSGGCVQSAVVGVFANELPNEQRDKQRDKDKDEWMRNTAQLAHLILTLLYYYIC